MSPTAHYTGHTWIRHGMSDPALGTTTGRILYDGLVPLEKLLGVVGGPTIEGFLVSRHRVIDAYLTEAIDDGAVSQVIEVACGLSPRGLAFHRRYGDRITYVEADLPHMARLKRERLDRIGPPSAHHRVVGVDVFAHDGPLSIAAIAGSLDPAAGTAIVTEGLVNYFDQRAAESMFHRFAAALGEFPTGLYVTDLYLAGDNRNPVSAAFGAALGVFVRGRVHTFYDSSAEAASALVAAGFASAELVRAADHPAAGDIAGDPAAGLVRVARATTATPSAS